MFKNVHLNFTSATVVSVVGAALALAVAFGADLSAAKINAITTLAGLIGAAITIGGGAKSAALIRTQFGSRLEGITFTPAAISAIIAAAIAVAVAFGLHLNGSEINAILKLVGLIGGGFAAGAALKSHAAIIAGVHPAYPSANKAGISTVQQDARAEAARPRRP